MHRLQLLRARSTTERLICHLRQLPAVSHADSPLTLPRPHPTSHIPGDNRSKEFPSSEAPLLRVKIHLHWQAWYQPDALREPSPSGLTRSLAPPPCLPIMPILPTGCRSDALPPCRWIAGNAALFSEVQRHFRLLPWSFRRLWARLHRHDFFEAAPCAALLHADILC